MSSIKNLPNGKLRIEIDDFAGYNSRMLPNAKTPLNSFPVMDNYYMDRVNDMLIKRDGTLRFVNNVISSETVEDIYEHLTSDGDDCVVAKTETALKYVNINGADPTSQVWLDISSSETGGRVDFLTYQNRMYVANRNEGVDSNKVWRGVGTDYHEHGLPPCNNIPIKFTTTTAGGIASGTYYYAVTFLYEDSQESGALLSFRALSTDSPFNDPVPEATERYYPRVILSTSGDITLTNLPIGSTRVTARKIYRSKAGDSSSLYELVTISDNTSTTYKDNMADADLGLEINPALLSDLKKPYNSKYQTVHKETLLQGNLIEQLYTPLNGENITVVANSIDPGSLDVNKTYKYRFYKAWVINEGETKPRIILSPYIEKSVVTEGANSVTITFDEALLDEEWSGLICIQRTEGDGDSFMWLDEQWIFGTAVYTLNHSGLYYYVDTIGDTSLLSDPPNNKATQLKIPQTYNGVFNSYVSLSETSLPDTFTTFRYDSNGNLTVSANTMRIGEDNGEAITGIFSEYNRVVVFKENSLHAIFTSAQSKAFWVSNILQDEIGASPRCILQLPDSKYFFGKITNEYSGKGSVKFYLWDGQREPIEVSVGIDTLLNSSGNIDINGMTYDNIKKWVVITTYNYANRRTNILIYDLVLNGWYVWYNDIADLGFKGVYKLKDYGVVFGARGTIHRQSRSVFDDLIYTGSSYVETGINTKLQLKTFDFGDMDYNLGKVRVTYYIRDRKANVTKGLSVKTYLKTDGNAEESGLLNTILPTPPVLQRTFQSLSGFGSSFYIRMENAQDINYAILYISVDLTPKHIEEGGK